jgi:hypothetical protein
MLSTVPAGELRGVSLGCAERDAVWGERERVDGVLDGLSITALCASRRTVVGCAGLRDLGKYPVQCAGAVLYRTGSSRGIDSDSGGGS